MREMSCVLGGVEVDHVSEFGGEVEEEAAAAPGKEEKAPEQAPEAAPVDLGEEPPMPEFILSVPNVTAIDLCVCALASWWTLPFHRTNVSVAGIAGTS